VNNKKEFICLECGFLIDTELIRDAYDDSREENFDGYYDCSTFSINCKKCSAYIEFDKSDWD